jgi:hypothetical protein
MNNGSKARGGKPNSDENFKESGAEQPDFIDSESGNIADSLTKILNVPTETISGEQSSQSKEDVLSGFGNYDDEGPVGGGKTFKETDEDFYGDAQGPSVDESGLFEDNELLAQIGVELIDMMMTYGAMAIAKDWDNEEKYAIKDKRKKRLEAPLQKILENRQVKTAPELVFAFMLVVSYSPVMITAFQERRRKKKEATGGVVQGDRPIVKQMAQPTILKQDEPEEEEEDDFGMSYSPISDIPAADPMSEMLSQMQPKRKAGRPRGGTDLKQRNAMDEEERGRAIEKAKAYRKDGWSFSRIAKTMNVSVGTAVRWCRS